MPQSFDPVTGAPTYRPYDLHGLPTVVADVPSALLTALRIGSRSGGGRVRTGCGAQSQSRCVDQYGDAGWGRRGEVSATIRRDDQGASQ
jgi:hypothetical protein